jgi:hypothetical protein
MKNLRHGSRCRGRDSKRTPSEYKSKVLPFEPACSVVYIRYTPDTGNVQHNTGVLTFNSLLRIDLNYFLKHNDSYSGGALFESRPELSYSDGFRSFPQYLQAHSAIIPYVRLPPFTLSPLLIDHPIIRPYIIRAIETVVKQINNTIKYIALTQEENWLMS